jgi:hypothetical protein
MYDSLIGGAAAEHRRDLLLASCKERLAAAAVCCRPTTWSRAVSRFRRPVAACC